MSFCVALLGVEICFTPSGVVRKGVPFFRHPFRGGQKGCTKAAPLLAWPEKGCRKAAPLRVLFELGCIFVVTFSGVVIWGAEKLHPFGCCQKRGAILLEPLPGWSQGVH